MAYFYLMKIEQYDHHGSLSSRMCTNMRYLFPKMPILRGGI